VESRFVTSVGPTKIKSSIPKDRLLSPGDAPWMRLKVMLTPAAAAICGPKDEECKNGDDALVFVP